MPTAYKITFELELSPPPEAPSKAEIAEHVKQAVKNWGGAYHPEDAFFPSKISVSGVSVVKRRPPALPRAPEARAMTRGDMVVDGEGGIGLVIEARDVTGLVRVTYGGDGPVRTWLPQVVRHATLAEINAAGLGSVGRNLTPEEE